MRAFLISCNLNVKSLFAGIKFSIIFSTPHLIVLAGEHCYEHDPIILSLSLSLSSAAPLKVTGSRLSRLTA